MNSKIKKLLNQLESVASNRASIESKLQTEYNKVFDDSKELAKVISNAEQASEYQMNEYGEVESWFRFSGLSDYSECKEYFETWLFENHGMRVDWNNDCFLYSQGESLLIQTGSRFSRDNGVYLGSKQVLSESDYVDEDGDVLTERRNELIEKYMEATGHFPGVFSLDQHGNVFHVNTQPKDKK